MSIDPPGRDREKSCPVRHRTIVQMPRVTTTEHTKPRVCVVFVQQHQWTSSGLQELLVRKQGGKTKSMCWCLFLPHAQNELSKHARFFTGVACFLQGCAYHVQHTDTKTVTTAVKGQYLHKTALEIGGWRAARKYPTGGLVDLLLFLLPLASSKREKLLGGARDPGGFSRRSAVCSGDN